MINTPPASTPLNVTSLERNLPDATDKMVRSLRATFDKGWASWFTQVFNICFAEAQSGITANRPTTNLWPGRPYFDTDLGAHGKKIFVDKDSAGWVDSSGNVV